MSLIHWRLFWIFPMDPISVIHRNLSTTLRRTVSSTTRIGHWHGMISIRNHFRFWNMIPTIQVRMNASSLGRGIRNLIPGVVSHPRKRVDISSIPNGEGINGHLNVSMDVSTSLWSVMTVQSHLRRRHLLHSLRLLLLFHQRQHQSPHRHLPTNH